MQAVPPLFTVFTPTFNRAWSLPRVYESLRAQNFRDFEWVIVDDGSTDNTPSLVKQWQDEADFPIIYEWQPNQGKHIAYNTVARLARGELFTSIDSDDEIVSNALQVMYDRWKNLSETDRKTIGGMSFLMKDQHGKLIGKPFRKDGEVVDLIDTYLVKGVRGDKGGFLQTKAFRQYPFPDDVKNVLVPESVFMHQFAHDWKNMCINEILGIVWIDDRSDHLTNSLSDVKSYPGIRYSYLALFNYSSRFFFKIPRIFFANAAHYSKVSFHLGNGIVKQAKDIHSFYGRLSWLLTLPIGYLMYRRERKRLATLS